MSPLLLGGAVATPIAMLIDAMTKEPNVVPQSNGLYGDDMMNLSPEQVLMQALQSSQVPNPMSTQATARAAEPASNYSRSPLGVGEFGSGTPLSAEDRMFIDATFGYNGAPPLEQLQAALTGAPKLPDDGMRDIPRDGTATTKGGVNRVNQYTSEHGVTATRDPATGQVTLTNIGANGKPTPQSQRQVYGFNPMSNTGSTALDTLYEQIRNTSDPAEARGLAATARTALAEESARIEASSLKFAENKIGLPNLMQRLRDSEALDQAAPGYMPGIGDSKNTAALRNEVAQAQAQARAVAGDFKNGNISAARLESTAKNIEAELRRLDQLQAKKDGLQATTDANIQRKKELKEIQDYDKYQSFTPAQRKLMATLNPELAAEADNMGATVAYFERQAKNDPAFLELFQAEPSEYLALAASGNKLAKELAIREESVATGRPPEVIDRELSSMRNLINPSSVRQWADRQTQGMLGDKVAARGQLIANRDLLIGSKDPADKKRLKAIDANIALEQFRAQKTAKFVADVSTWGMSDPAIQTAVQQAKQVSGKTDIDSVLTAYIGASTGPESLAKYTAFKEAIRAAAEKESKSIFGGIDSAAVLSQIDTAAKEKGALAAWYKDRYGWTEDLSRSVVTSVANLFGQ